MRPDYKKWLEDQKYSSGTISAQLHRAGRLEEYYGDLERLSNNNMLQGVLDELTYSTEDERRNRPNPSKIPFEGNIRTNLASYKDGLKRYQKFLAETPTQNSTGSLTTSAGSVDEILASANVAEAASQKLSLERDMQAALRLKIEQLSPTLTIVDDGAERSVESGFIDILCEDASDGALVVVELKAGKTDSRVIGQILGYMGDLLQVELGRTVRGILVAQDFDGRTVSASRAVPQLSLMRYSVQFKFEQIL